MISLIILIVVNITIRSCGRKTILKHLLGTKRELTEEPFVSLPHVFDLSFDYRGRIVQIMDLRMFHAFRLYNAHIHIYSSVFSEHLSLYIEEKSLTYILSWRRWRCASVPLFFFFHLLYISSSGMELQF